MRHVISAVVVMCILSALPVFASPAPQIDLALADVPVQQAMAAIAEQGDVHIQVVREPDTPVTVDLEGVSVETAIHEAAVQAGCSWVRMYVLYTGDKCSIEAPDIRKGVSLARKVRHSLLSQDDKDAMADAVEDRIMKDVEGLPEQTPLGGYVVRPEGTDDVFSRMSIDDPVVRLMSAEYSDPVSVSADGMPLSDALDQVGLNSGFFVLTADDVAAAQIALDMQDAPVDDIVAAVADQAGCNWSRLYVVGYARKLSDQELDERMDGLFNMGMSRFWNEPPNERQQIIDKVIARTNDLTPEQRKYIRSSQIAKRMMSRFMNYTMKLPAEKRKELMPLMQQAARLMQ